MKLESQVVSLDLAKRMQRLGAPQDSHFWWHDCEHPVDSHRDAYVTDNKEYDTDPAFECVFSAYTVAEIGEMLPVFVGDQYYKLEICNHTGGGWFVTYYNKQERRNLRSVLHCADADTEADARAKMWIYLKENKLI